MELSIGQVAKRAGISARMLRHYDALGLYRPTRVGDSGYRWYEQASLPRLLRIVALRRAGIGLPDITRILSEEAPEAGALRIHLDRLHAERERLDTLIASIEQQITALDHTVIEDPAVARDEHRRQRSAFARRLSGISEAGAETVMEGSPTDELSRSDMEHLSARGRRLLTGMADLIGRGVAPGSAAAMRVVGEHYASVREHVHLPLEAYGSLGSLYLTDPLQRSIAENIHPGLPAWLAAAIERFSDPQRESPSTRRADQQA